MFSNRLVHTIAVQWIDNTQWTHAIYYCVVRNSESTHSEVIERDFVKCNVKYG